MMMPVIWFRWLYHTNQFRDWDDFVDKLFIQFRSRTRAPFAVNRQAPVARSTQPLSCISSLLLPQFRDELVGCTNKTDPHKLFVEIPDRDTDVDTEDTMTNDHNTCVTDGGKLATTVLSTLEGGSSNSVAISEVCLVSSNPVGGKNPAISVQEKSGLATAVSKADGVLAPRYIDKSFGISFPFDPGAPWKHDYFESSGIDSERSVFDDKIDRNLLVMLDINSEQVVNFQFYIFSVMLQVLEFDPPNQLMEFELLDSFDISYLWLQNMNKLSSYINQKDRAHAYLIEYFTRKTEPTTVSLEIANQNIKLSVVLERHDNRNLGILTVITITFHVHCILHYFPFDPGEKQLFVTSFQRTTTQVLKLFDYQFEQSTTANLDIMEFRRITGLQILECRVFWRLSKDQRFLHWMSCCNRESAKYMHDCEQKLLPLDPCRDVLFLYLRPSATYNSFGWIIVTCAIVQQIGITSTVRTCVVAFAFMKMMCIGHFGALISWTDDYMKQLEVSHIADSVMYYIAEHCCLIASIIELPHVVPWSTTCTYKKDWNVHYWEFLPKLQMQVISFLVEAFIQRGYPKEAFRLDDLSHNKILANFEYVEGLTHFAVILQQVAAHPWLLVIGAFEWSIDNSYPPYICLVFSLVFPEHLKVPLDIMCHYVAVHWNVARCMYVAIYFSVLCLVHNMLGYVLQPLVLFASHEFVVLLTIMKTIHTTYPFDPGIYEMNVYFVLKSLVPSTIVYLIFSNRCKSDLLKRSQDALLPLLRLNSGLRNYTSLDTLHVDFYEGKSGGFLLLEEMSVLIWKCRTVWWNSKKLKDSTGVQTARVFVKSSSCLCHCQCIVYMESEIGVRYLLLLANTFNELLVLLLILGCLLLQHSFRREQCNVQVGYATVAIHCLLCVDIVKQMLLHFFLY